MSSQKMPCCQSDSGIYKAALFVDVLGAKRPRIGLKRDPALSSWRNELPAERNENCGYDLEIV